jgi:hypothetical protein
MGISIKINTANFSALLMLYPLTKHYSAKKTTKNPTQLPTTPSAE